MFETQHRRHSTNGQSIYCRRSVIIDAAFLCTLCVAGGSTRHSKRAARLQMLQLFGWWRRCRKGDGVGDGIFAVDWGGGWPGWRLRCGLEPSPVWMRCVCLCVVHSSAGVCACVRAACVRAHARVFAARVCVSNSYVCCMSFCSCVCPLL